MFITFEGPEGSGKSTQIALLSAYLQQQGLAVVATREPGGTRIGDQIRSCVHDVANTGMTAVTEMLLYSAARAQIVAEVIRPALAAGKIILCDRYADSSLAYQGYGRGIDLDDLKQITRIATTGLQPDLTFLLDIPVEQGLARRTSGGEEMNRLDRETVGFHRRVREGYHLLAAAEPDRWLVVDAARPVAEVQNILRRLLDKRLAVVD